MSHDALRTILPVAAWTDDRARAVEITSGADPILPTPFRIGETSAAALAAVGLAVSDLWALRTGRRQDVAVDTRQATASLRSGHYMKLDGAQVSTERNTIMGTYPAKNGRWSYLHCNFPNHRAAALSVLGVPEDREAVRQAVAKWDALELEEAIIAANGADVLKITAKHLPNIGYQEYDTGHGKLSAHLDLREPRDVEILQTLVREVDVFSQGYRPGTLGGRGFSPEELAKLRPGIVFVSLCAFSHVGPWASRRGFDTVVQTVSGITSRQGDLFPGAQPGPQFYPVSAIDYLTGYLMAFGAMVALARRAREGGSWLVRISLAQTGRWLVGRGQVPEAQLKDVPKEFTPEELKRWSMTSETPVGRLHHLAPVLRLSATPPHWSRPTVPLGYHEPMWPARGA